MGLDARRLGIAEPHFVLQQFRHGRYALLVFLHGNGINVLRLPVTVFLRVVNFKIVLQLSGCVGIFLVELFALQVEGVFGLLPVIFILPDFQLLVIAVENRDMYRQGKIRVAEPVVCFA